MRHYDFFCHACSRVFSKKLTPAEYEDGEFVCPHCESGNVEQRWATFIDVTSKKSA